MTVPRWVDSEHERVGALFRAARAVPTPPAPSLRALQPRRRVVLSPRLAVVVVVGSLLALASAAGVVVRSSGRSAAPPVVAPPLPRAQRLVAPTPMSEEPTPVAPPPTPVVVRAPRRQAPAVLPPPAPPPPAEVPRSTLGEEAKVIAAALGALRAGRAAETVEVLAQYRDRFPHGALLPEAVLAEARAERALHHLAEALAALDRLDPEVITKHPELLVMRGELLAERGDCAAAIATLDAVLADPPSPMVAERAQFTRAKCAVIVNEPTARAQLENYLRAWPSGAFVDEALGLLEVTP